MEKPLVDSSLEKRQSTLIKAMRFPLIVLVVYAHSRGFILPQTSNPFDGWHLFHFFSEMISNNFCKIAVCWFFVFAGYFFFLNLPQQGLTRKWLIGKWERRIWTLLIPYLIWNLLYVFIYTIKNYIFSKLGILQADIPFWSVGFSPVYWFITGPMNYPLWFMRDLMMMTLLSPLVYVIFKHTPLSVGIIILSCLLILPFETKILTWRGYFFFSLGSFLGIKKINILSLCRKFKWPAAILAFILLIIASLYNDAPFHSWLLRAFFPFGMISFMNLCDVLINKESRCDRLCKLSAAVFFIYAAHEIYILGWSKGLLLRIFGESLVGTWIRYLFVPVVVVGVCLALFYFFNRIMPRSLAFICGGRSKK